MACLGVVIRTLVYLDERPIADWKLSITPASFISTFVTVSRFLMLVGVAEGVAQLRWLYYLGGPRRLDHLDSFDSASRGPWGSFLFACRHSIRGTVPAIARMGAIVTIIALAMDPFAQQIVYVVQQPQNRTLDDNAWMLATTRFDNQDASVYDDGTYACEYRCSSADTKTSLEASCDIRWARQCRSNHQFWLRDGELHVLSLQFTGLLHLVQRHCRQRNPNLRAGRGSPE